MQVGVKVRGSDAQGKSFEEEALTLAINAHGALVQLQARLTSGGTVLLQHKQTKEEQECHVVFLGPVRSGKAEIGLEFTEACPSFWRVAFPPEDWSPKHPEARSVMVHTRDSVRELKANQSIEDSLLPGFSTPVSAFFELT